MFCDRLVKSVESRALAGKGGGRMSSSEVESVVSVADFILKYVANNKLIVAITYQQSCGCCFPTGSAYQGNS